MKRAILSALLATGLLLSGCGNNEDEQAKSEISDYLVKQQENQQMMQLKPEEADCIANGMVDGIGVDQLKEYGFLKDDGTVNEKAETPKMNEEDSKTMVNSMFDCTDVMGTMREQLQKSLGNQPAKVKDCFNEKLTEDAVRGMLTATFEGDQNKAGQELLGPLMECTAAGSGQPEN
jgi:PBP1b-binding outer membrane lipoprotein LpoB